jgi:hypothetical protein
MNRIFLVYIMLSIICLAGCRRSEPSIVGGTWTFTSYRIVTDSNNITINDTTLKPNFSADTSVFYANGQCVLAHSPSPFYGTYKLVSNTIVLSYIVNNKTYMPIDTILSLTSHSLLLTAGAEIAYITINNSDTTVYTHHYFYGYMR